MNFSKNLLDPFGKLKNFGFIYIRNNEKKKDENGLVFHCKHALVAMSLESPGYVCAVEGVFKKREVLFLADTIYLYTEGSKKIY